MKKNDDTIYKMTDAEVEEMLKKRQLNKQAQETAQAIDDVMDSFSDEVIDDDEDDEDDYYEYDDCDEEEETVVEKATNMLHGFTDFIRSQAFKDEVNNAAKANGVPPKKVADTFFGKALGTIGDVLGVAINTGGNAAHALIDIINTVLHGAVNLIVSIANALARLVTLNNTCCGAVA